MKPPLASIALLVGTALPVQGQDAGFDLWDLHYARGYASMSLGSAFPTSRYVEGLDLSGGAEAYDLTFGLEVGRYTSIEIDLAYVEFDVTAPTHGKIAELTLATFIPQLRLQLPLANDRLVPWISGGVGPATLTVNDRTHVGADIVAGWWRWGWGVSADAGVQYFVAPNLGLATELRYLRASRRTRLDKERFVQGVGAAASGSISLQWYVPRAPPERLFQGVTWSRKTGLRNGLYFALAFGVRGYSEPQVTPETRFHSKDGGEQSTDVALGIDVSDRVGIELTGIFHEIPIKTDAKLVEYATWLVAPQLRLRLTSGGAVVPHVMGGVGLGVGETNDPQPANVDDPAGGFAGGGLSLAATLGAGFTVSLESNVHLFVDARYLRHRSSLTRNGRSLPVDASGTQLAAGLRFHFW